MKGTYIVEFREPTKGGDDYEERDQECNSPEEVKEAIAEKHEDENIHAVYFYREGTDCNPKDVTNRF